MCHLQPIPAEQQSRAAVHKTVKGQLKHSNRERNHVATVLGAVCGFSPPIQPKAADLLEKQEDCATRFRIALVDDGWCDAVNAWKQLGAVLAHCQTARSKAGMEQQMPSQRELRAHGLRLRATPVYRRGVLAEATLE